jgi:predicted transcriptional regulator
MPTTAKPAEGKVVLYLEVPKALKEQLDKLAKDDLRSLTAECVVALREFVARRTAEKEGGAQ